MNFHFNISSQLLTSSSYSAQSDHCCLVPFDLAEEVQADVQMSKCLSDLFLCFQAAII